MKRNRPALLASVLLASALSLFGCGRAATPASGDTGRVVLAIASAPADAACLRITAKGPTTAVRLLPLVVGSNTVFTLDGLPLGTVQLAGDAFSVACSALVADSVATYVSDAVTAVLVEGQTLNVSIVLHRPGRVIVSVDFPDAGAGLANGAACGSASQCASGFCANGVCCNTACTGACQACNLTPAGTCTARPVGTVCGPSVCMGSSLVQASTCTAGGVCSMGATQTCSPYFCSNQACKTSCGVNADCQAGFVCQGGACVTNGGANGSPCSSATQCASGFCVDGVCCNTSCGGTCMACNLSTPGTCSPEPVGTLCAAAACMGNTSIPTSTCNGTGECSAGPAVTCAPYLCQGAACQTSCTTSADCQVGFNCQSGLCVAGNANGVTCSGGSQCASGFCVDGVCCSSACNGSCEACNLPFANGVCSPEPLGTVCAPAACQGSTVIPASTCSGTGSCIAGVSQSCAPFTCLNGACTTSNTVTLAPVADAYVRDGTTAAMNFGLDPSLQVKSSTTVGNTRVAYLRFSLAGVGSAPTSAKLHLFGQRPTATTVTDGAFAVADVTWTEGGITWNTRPALGAEIGQGVVVDTTAQYFEWDVTSYVQAQRSAGATSVSIAVQMNTASASSDTFNSREAPSNPPTLVVTF